MANDGAGKEGGGLMSDKSEYKFQAENLIAGYDRHTVLKGIDLAIPEGKLTMIVGLNGCGKSTLLKCLSGLLKSDFGSIIFEGIPLHDFSSKKLAMHLAYLPQNPIAPAGIAVFDLVARGRTPYQNFLNQWSKDDEAIVKSSLCHVQLDKLAGALLSELSGGQRQRAWIAMSLAQSTNTILLDEGSSQDLLIPLQVQEVGEIPVKIEAKYSGQKIIRSFKLISRSSVYPSVELQTVTLENSQRKDLIT